MIPRKKTKKFGTVINTCVSLIKQDWKKMVEVPQKHDLISRRKILDFILCHVLLKVVLFH